MVLGLLKKRRMRKTAKENLRHARHLLNMREDIMPEAQLASLKAGIEAAATALKERDAAAIESTGNLLFDTVCELSPKRAFPAFRENVEVVVVAVAVAMAFRTYYLQPFKIPTGSMQPTLYGIHAEDNGDATILDRVPFKYAKWIVTGRMRHEIRVKGGGVMSRPESAGIYHPASVYYQVGARRYRLPKYARPRFMPGAHVPDGAILWSGHITAGDHVFVNKVAWNFRRPRRGEIMVFDTNGIRGIQQNTHYIKRLVATPRETVSIVPPYLLADGVRVASPKTIRRIAEKHEGYHGFQVTGETHHPTILTHPGDRFTLGEGQYFALGDNTLNSKDGRYWGAVPQANLVGPAALIYWPLSRRWGLIR